MMHGKSGPIALCGVLAALAAVLMLLGGIFPGATYCAPLLASLVLIPAQEECGPRAAWGLFTAAALLSLLLCADKDAALLFAALGYYPILKARFDAVRPGLLSRLCKLAFFNAAVLAAYAVLLFVLVSDTARAEFREMGKAMTAALLLGGNIVFLLYDFVLRRLRPLYVGRLQPVLRRLFR